jgi:hypothetical protein
MMVATDISQSDVTSFIIYILHLILLQRGDMGRNIFRIFAGKPEGKISVRKPWHRLNDTPNIKKDL